MIDKVPKSKLKKITMTEEEISKYKTMLDKYHSTRKKDPERLMKKILHSMSKSFITA